MKKLAILAISLMFSQLGAQENNTLHFGIQWGFHGNQPVYNGGMEVANARFQVNDFGGAAIDFVARYDHNKHWMVQSGIGFMNYGFEFSLNEDYSLLIQTDRRSVIRSQFGALNVPLMVFYKFNPNCKNKKWIMGAGVVAAATGKKTIDKSFEKGTEGNTNYKYLNSVSSSFGANSLMLRFSIAKEKTLKCGGILQAGFVFNVGFNELAKTDVTYTADNTVYTHQFVNRGNFVGLRFVYFCNHLQKKLGE